MPKIYKVGGCVRDELLGVKTKDIDFTFVLDNLNQTVQDGYNEMRNYLLSNNFTIFVETPDMFTIRAKFPKTGHPFSGLDADFVMARKEVGYAEGTRKPILELGTLEDDLVRRDFTVNALAEDENGTIIDLFNGIEDLKERVLKTPLDPSITFNDDPLRALRAIRFSIVKKMSIAENVEQVLCQSEVWNGIEEKVSGERIREELEKCFKFDTVKTLNKISYYNSRTNGLVYNVIFTKGLRLMPTYKQ